MGVCVCVAERARGTLETKPIAESQLRARCRLHTHTMGSMPPLTSFLRLSGCPSSHLKTICKTGDTAVDRSRRDSVSGIVPSYRCFSQALQALAAARRFQ